LQCVAVYCSVLQLYLVFVLDTIIVYVFFLLRCSYVGCHVYYPIAVCCSVLHCVLQSVVVPFNALQCAAVRVAVCVATCCSRLQCVAVCVTLCCSVCAVCRSFIY